MLVSVRFPRYIIQKYFNQNCFKKAVQQGKAPAVSAKDLSQRRRNQDGAGAAAHPVLHLFCPL